MRPKFEQTLQTYGAVAKDMAVPDKTPERQKELETVLRWNINKSVRDRASTPEAQKQIFAIQQQKQKIMADLHKALARLDEPQTTKEMPKDAVFVTSKQGAFKARRPDGKSETVTLGELLTDGEWGIRYVLDVESVPRNIQKRFLIERAKLALREFADQQIIEDELSSAYTHEYTKEAYQGMKEDADNRSERAGIVAEKMVRNFLKKCSIDAALPFDIGRTDAFTDVQQKIDFFIRKNDHNRGAKVTADQANEEKGIQFTINTDWETIRHKKEQIAKSKKRLRPEDRIIDIVLVVMPLRDVTYQFRKWQQNKTYGGPEKQWSRITQEQIFKGVLKDMFTPDVVDAMWQKVSDAPMSSRA